MSNSYGAALSNSRGRFLSVRDAKAYSMYPDDCPQLELHHKLEIPIQGVMVYTGGWLTS